MPNKFSLKIISTVHRVHFISRRIFFRDTKYCVYLVWNVRFIRTPSRNKIVFWWMTKACFVVSFRLTATGYFCYLRSAHRLINEHWNLPLRHELLQLSPQVLTLVVLIAFLFAMLWKVSSYWHFFLLLLGRIAMIR